MRPCWGLLLPLGWKAGNGTKSQREHLLPPLIFKRDIKTSVGMTQTPKPKSGRGSVPGSRKGIPNKNSPDRNQILLLRDAAQAHGFNAIQTLAEIMYDQRTDKRVRIIAARELLDRGYGKATLLVAGDDTMPPIQTSSVDYSKLSTGTLREILAASEKADQQDEEDQQEEDD